MTFVLMSFFKNDSHLNNHRESTAVILNLLPTEQVTDTLGYRHLLTRRAVCSEA